MIDGNANSFSPRDCNVCGSSGAALLITKSGHNVYQCPKCGLAYTDPIPTAIAEQYDSSYFDLYRRRRAFRLKRGGARLKVIELIKQPGRLLDIGCSLGYFVEAADARGWRASGVEISPYASQEARQLGLDVRTGILEDAGYESESFDCVSMWDVLEHVTDPTLHMAEIAKILAPGGLVVIGTPNLGHPAFRMKREQWRHLKPSEHIYYFQKDSIAALLDKTGFDVVLPPVIGGRPFPGGTVIGLKCWFARTFQPNDVLTVYGVKR